MNDLNLELAQEAEKLGYDPVWFAEKETGKK